MTWYGEASSMTSFQIPSEAGMDLKERKGPGKRKIASSTLMG
jgi:hypothetical protein